MKKPRLLLHVCCGPCATVAIEELRENYCIVLFFYNPNIEPIEEWQKRLESTKKIANICQLPLLVDDGGVQQWQNLVKPLAQEAEGGCRCWLCYQWRLEQAIQRASQENCTYLATTLTTSPYKDSEKINQIGNKVSSDFKKYKIKYLSTNFQDNGGYQQSIQLSRQHNLYRQKYCGCWFSR